MLNRLKSWLTPFWISLQYREQVALVVCGVSLLAFVTYVGIARPLIAHKNATAKELTAQEARFERIVDMFERLTPVDRVEVETLVDDTARAKILSLAQEYNITIDRIQSGDGRFTLVINQVHTVDVFQWLAQIQKQLSLQPINATMRKAGDKRLAAQISFAAQGK